MEPQRDTDERVSSEADRIDFIRAFLHMTPRAEDAESDDECPDEPGAFGLATD
jgi:hypothetical protein